MAAAPRRLVGWGAGARRRGSVVIAIAAQRCAAYGAGGVGCEPRVEAWLAKHVAAWQRKRSLGICGLRGGVLVLQEGGVLVAMAGGSICVGCVW